MSGVGCRVVPSERPAPHTRHPTPQVVVLTGSESTGKTTLAARLAARYATGWAPEFAREYLDAKGSLLDASDVEPIARGQIALEDRARRVAAGAGVAVVFLDTDLASTAVYARHYYGACPPWIERAARERRGDLYLLCRPDVPWVADRQRDRAERRDELHALVRAELAALGARWVEIGGGWVERERRARDAVDALLH